MVKCSNLKSVRTYVSERTVPAYYRHIKKCIGKKSYGNHKDKGHAVMRYNVAHQAAKKAPRFVAHGRRLNHARATIAKGTEAFHAWKAHTPILKAKRLAKAAPVAVIAASPALRRSGRHKK